MRSDAHAVVERRRTLKVATRGVGVPTPAPHVLGNAYDLSALTADCDRLGARCDCLAMICATLDPRHDERGLIAAADRLVREGDC